MNCKIIHNIIINLPLMNVLHWNPIAVSFGWQCILPSNSEQNNTSYT